MVGVYACELRLAVNHHQYGTGSVTADSAQLYMPGSVVAHSKSENAALGDKQARHHAGYCGKYLCLSGCFQLSAVNH